MLDKRITIFAGHFGSGKTEVAVNYALQMKQRHDNVAIVDFDIVNPFFRTADAKQALEAQGVLVYLPVYANKNVESSNFPLEVNTVFNNKSIFSVFDVGGDDLGAKAISRFKKEFQKEEYDFFLVVNARRPITDTTPKIVEMCKEVQESAGIKPTGLINNTNILQFTTPEIIEEGQKMIEKAAKTLGYPVVFTSGMEPYISGVDVDEAKKLVLNKYIHLPWNK